MKLVEKLPYFYENKWTSPIEEALDIEKDKFNKSVDDTLAQFFVESATYGLDNWELMLGISKNILSTETRRENIKARMRSRGTTTEKLIKSICESYSNGEVEIINNAADYSFTIKFVGSFGIPKALDQLNETIEKIKPAHLAHKFEFSYITWDMFDNFNNTWNQWDTLNLTWDQLEVYKKEVI